MMNTPIDLAKERDARKTLIWQCGDCGGTWFQFVADVGLVCECQAHQVDTQGVFALLLPGCKK